MPTSKTAPPKSDEEMAAAFTADFEKLKKNRENVPAELLRTKYADAYKDLCQSVEQEARWFMGAYLGALALPEHPKDTAGVAWARRKIDAILKEEALPGGLIYSAISTLILDLDYRGFIDKTYRLWTRMKTEIWMPYQRRYNKWVTYKGRRVIWSSLFQAFWHPIDDALEGGIWIGLGGTVVDRLYPPDIGPDPEALKETEKGGQQE